MKLLIQSRNYPLKARFRLQGKSIFVSVYEYSFGAAAAWLPAIMSDYDLSFDQAQAVTGGFWVCQGEQQICHGGRFSGDTVLFLGDLQSDFDKKCRSWWRQFMAKKEAMPGGRPIECWS